MKRIGVLALQGDFEAHAKVFRELGADTIEVRKASQLDEIDGLVIPGGESTTMLKLLNLEGLMEPLRRFGRSRPLFATCAGAILLAREVRNPVQESLGLADITIERNAYGRQLDSRVAKISTETAANGHFPQGEIEAVFIRAPIIRRVGDGIQVLASYQGDPVLIEAGPHVIATFHPELSSGHAVQSLFLAKVKEADGVLV